MWPEPVRGALTVPADSARRAVVADAFATLGDHTTNDWLTQSASRTPADTPDRLPLREMAASLG